MRRNTNWLSIKQPTNQPTNQGINQSINQQTKLVINQSINQPINSQAPKPTRRHPMIIRLSSIRDEGNQRLSQVLRLFDHVTVLSMMGQSPTLLIVPGARAPLHCFSSPVSTAARGNKLSMPFGQFTNASRFQVQQPSSQSGGSPALRSRPPSTP